MNKLVFVIVFSVLLLIPVSIQIAFADTFTVNTNQPSYMEGDTVIVSGVSLPIIPSTPVTIQIFFGGDLIDIAQVTVANDGAYFHSFIAQGPLWQFSGTYIVKAFYGIETVQASFEFEGPQGPPPPPPPDDPPQNPTVTVNTEQDCYVIGNLVRVFGDVLPPSQITPVTIQIFFMGNLIDIAQVSAVDGNYEHLFIAQGPLWDEEGTYIIRGFYGTATVENSFDLFFDECPIVVGGEIIPIDFTSLIIAGAQSFSWIIPVVLSIVGIGIIIMRKI